MVKQHLLRMNDKNEVAITTPKDLNDVRVLLNKPRFKDKTSEKEQLIGAQLTNDHAVN